LLDAVPEHHQTSIHQLVEGLDGFEELQRGISWYGEAWKWTVEYTIGSSDGGESQTVCYVVPNVTTPVVCVPLDAIVLEKLPIRRLARVIREGIRSAKCAVTIYWAIWHPTTKVEAEGLTDLVKRKIKLFKELNNGNGSGNGSTKRKTKATGAAGGK